MVYIASNASKITGLLMVFVSRAEVNAKRQQHFECCEEAVLMTMDSKQINQNHSTNPPRKPFYVYPLIPLPVLHCRSGHTAIDKCATDIADITNHFFVQCRSSYCQYFRWAIHQSSCRNPEIGFLNIKLK